jgi:ABC-2 type transport system ATP-binding protein
MQIEVKNLKRHFRRVKAVNDISFSFGSGEVVGFVGPNGAGKTTTMRILATLDDPTDGDVLLDGVSIVDYPEVGRRQIGYMPDALPEHSDMTAFEYVDFFGRAFGLHGSSLRKAVNEVEDFTGLGPIRDKTLKSLSKGMKQRVSLARALVHQPSLLIMDEPANGLDPRARVELRELVRALAESGKTILVSSHILTELSEFCSTVLIIERGEMVGDGTLEKLANHGRVTQNVLIRPLELTPEALKEILLQSPGVITAHVRGNACAAEVSGNGPEASALLTTLIQQGVKLLEFRPEQADLEKVFMTITKGDLA